MSYVENIDLVIRQIVSSELPNRGTGSWRKRRVNQAWRVKDKLHKYLARCVQPKSDKQKITIENIGIGWAGLKTKKRLVQRQEWWTGCKSNFIRRTTHLRAEKYRLDWAIDGVGAIAQTEEVTIPSWDYVVFIRSGKKKGSVQFYSNETGPLLKVDWIQIKEQSPESPRIVRESWRKISVLDEDGVAKPLYPAFRSLNRSFLSGESSAG